MKTRQLWLLEAGPFCLSWKCSTRTLLVHATGEAALSTKKSCRKAPANLPQQCPSSVRENILPKSLIRLPILCATLVHAEFSLITCFVVCKTPDFITPFDFWFHRHVLLHGWLTLEEYHWFVNCNVWRGDVLLMEFFFRASIRGFTL